MKQGTSYVQKKSWKGRRPNRCGGGNASDKYANMVTEHDTVSSACKATLTSNTDEEDVMGKFLKHGVDFLRLTTFFSDWRIRIQYESDIEDGTTVQFSDSYYDFKIYPKTCTRRQYFEDNINVGYLKDYAPMPKSHVMMMEARREKCETIQNCFGYFSLEGKFTAIINKEIMFNFAYVGLLLFVFCNNRRTF